MPRISVDLANLSLSVITLRQLDIGVLGVITFTSEIATDTVRFNFAAVSFRPAVLMAKIIVFGS